MSHEPKLYSDGPQRYWFECSCGFMGETQPSVYQVLERSKWVQAWHHRRYGDDRDLPVTEWGPFNEGDI